MSEVNFFVHGNPVAQGRPRFFRRGSFVGCYDPSKSKSWKDTIVWQAIENKVPLLDGALDMRLVFSLKRPKSLPKKVIHHVKKPDLDNLTKAVKDALKGIAYKDDSQIISCMALKRYGEPLGVQIQIYEGG